MNIQRNIYAFNTVVNTDKEYIEHLTTQSPHNNKQEYIDYPLWYEYECKYPLSDLETQPIHKNHVDHYRFF